MRLSFTTRPFSSVAFEAVCREACQIAPELSVPDQVRYLVTYLGNAEMGAKSLVVERPYVDRHFLTEYQGYYATALRDVPRHTTRVHVFAEDVRVEDVIQRLGEAETGEVRARIQDDLQRAYLGFIVLRPLPTAPVGRTVLRWYGGQDARCFGPQPPPHRVHILGLNLKAHGVQFHQQDRAVGACATAAVWCALASVMRRDGGRSPTPLAVTELANQSLPTSRALPAVAGLTLEQMIGAINASGYSPDVIKPEGHPAIFMLQLMTYVRSGIPVVLQVREVGAAEGHAVTVVGFRVSDGEHHAVPIEYPFKDSYSLRSLGMTRIYIHDDRLGPYARMVWDEEEPPDTEAEERAELTWRVQQIEAILGLAPTDTPADDEPTDPAIQPLQAGRFPALRFLPGSKEFESFDKQMRIWTAIAPLYPKIRISALDLLSVAMEVWPMASFLAGKDRAEVHLASFFSLGGAYLSSLFDLPISARRAADIASGLLVSRYVGILRFHVGSEWLLDVVCDATDIHRERPAWSSVFAVVPANEASAQGLRRQVDEQFPHVVVG